MSSRQQGPLLERVFPPMTARRRTEIQPGTAPPANASQCPNAGSYLLLLKFTRPAMLYWAKVGSSPRGPCIDELATGCLVVTSLSHRPCVGKSWLELAAVVLSGSAFA